MVTDITITGSADFYRVAHELQRAGRTGLRRELLKGLTEASTPLIEATRNAARQELPKHGGLADKVAEAPQRVLPKGGRSPSVRLVAGRAGSGARGADFGHVRHPVFGNRDVWRTTNVPPGWFTDTLKHCDHDVRPALILAMERVCQQAVHGGG